MLIDLLILLNKILYCPTDCPINGEGLQVKTLEALIFLERAKGFEPSTHGLGSRYSTTELRPHHVLILLGLLKITSYFLSKKCASIGVPTVLSI